MKLRYLNEWTTARKRNAIRYQKLFREFALEEYVTAPIEPRGCHHVYNQFVTRIRQRDDLRKHLNCEGVPTEIYYPLTLYLQPAFAYLGYKLGDFPEAEAASREVLALPVSPELTEEQQAAVVQTIANLDTVEFTRLEEIVMVQIPQVAVVGSGYWGKNLVRTFHELGALRCVWDTREEPLPKRVVAMA